MSTVSVASARAVLAGTSTTSPGSLIDSTSWARPSDCPGELPGERVGPAGAGSRVADPATTHQGHEGDGGHGGTDRERGEPPTARPSGPPPRRCRRCSSAMGMAHHIRHTTDHRPRSRSTSRTGGSRARPPVTMVPAAPSRIARLPMPRVPTPMARAVTTSIPVKPGTVPVGSIVLVTGPMSKPWPTSCSRVGLAGASTTLSTAMRDGVDRPQGQAQGAAPLTEGDGTEHQARDEHGHQEHRGVGHPDARDEGSGEQGVGPRAAAADHPAAVEEDQRQHDRDEHRLALPDAHREEAAQAVAGAARRPEVGDGRAAGPRVPRGCRPRRRGGSAPGRRGR